MNGRLGSRDKRATCVGHSVTFKERVDLRRSSGAIGSGGYTSQVIIGARVSNLVCVKSGRAGGCCEGDGEH